MESSLSVTVIFSVSRRLLTSLSDAFSVDISAIRFSTVVSRSSTTVTEAFISSVNMERSDTPVRYFASESCTDDFNTLISSNCLATVFSSSSTLAEDSSSARTFLPLLSLRESAECARSSSSLAISAFFKVSNSR